MAGSSRGGHPFEGFGRGNEWDWAIGRIDDIVERGADRPIRIYVRAAAAFWWFLGGVAPLGRMIISDNKPDQFCLARRLTCSPKWSKINDLVFNAASNVLKA